MITWDKLVATLEQGLREGGWNKGGNFNISALEWFGRGCPPQPMAYRRLAEHLAEHLVSVGAVPKGDVVAQEEAIADATGAP